MNETTTTPATTSAPAANNGKPKSKKAAPKIDMSESRVKVLKAASVAGSLEAVTKRAKMPHRAVYHHLWHLRKDGFVRSRDLDVDGAKELVFEHTAKGTKAAKKAS